MKRIISLILCAVLTLSTFSAVSNTDVITAEAASYADQLRSKGFPEDYIDKLTALHQKYPNWIFQPFNTGFDWNYAVKMERTPHSDQVIEKNVTKTSDWCQCSVCYKNGAYVIQEYPNWISASQETVEYYMDPRNWLNEEGIFQFESTAYDGTQTIEGIESILEGTWMHNSKITYKDANGKTQTVKYSNLTEPKYSQSILRAANYSGMSAYYLASKIRQEIGGKTPTAGGASGTVNGYKGIYNYYNIAAYTGANDGLKWASVKGTEGYYTNCQCRLRAKATTNSAELVMLPENTQVTYEARTTGQDDNRTWYKVKVNYNNKNYEGYIRADLVDHSTGASYGRPWTDPDKSIFYGAMYIANNFGDQTSGYLQKFNVNPKSSSVFGHEYMRNVAAAASESRSTYNAYNKAGILGVTKTFQIPVFKNMVSAPPATTIKEISGVKNGFAVTWNKISETTGYQIQYATRSDFSNAATVYAGPTNTTNKTITGRAADTVYYVRVRTYKNNNGTYLWGDWTAAQSVLTFSVDGPKPTSITSAKGIENGFTVNWEKTSDTTGYQLQYATKSDFSNAAIIYAGAKNTSSKTVTGRAANTVYYVRVRTYKNLNGNYYFGEWSDAKSVKTTDIIMPAATAITSLNGIKNGFTVSWSKVSNTTGYQIQYATRSDFSNAATIYGGGKDTTSKTITGRAADTTYYVRVRTYRNINGTYHWVNWSPAKSVMTYSVVPPKATSITSVTGVKNGFKLDWSKVDDTTGYQIQYATRSDFSNAATIYGGPKNTTSKTITGRAAQTRYYVRIRTYKNVNGEYTWGAWNSGTKSVVTL